MKSENLLGTSDHWKAFYDHPRPCVADVIIDNKINEMTNIYKVYAKSVLIPDGIRTEGWYPNLGGKNRYVVFDAAPIRDENGKLIAAIETLQDITDRNQAEEKLKDTLESLRKAVGTTIQVMVSAVEARDPYTSGHQIRSANLARTIATEMGLSQEKIEGIRMAGSIHDIGKLSIPAEILSKPTKLSELEFSLIKEHAQQGYEMLKNVESPWPLAEIVYQHHERMDGSGYPRNLKGDEICMEARILAVADVVEAMASHRPYRPALGIDAALNEIEKNRGTLYDKAVVDTCLKLFREKGFKLEGT
jgi:putative nucleotidyltransferase with HDIG domain